MIGPEDIQETPKKNYTPIFILGIAAVLLLFVGFISYRDYVNAKAEEKVADSQERIRKLEEKLEKYGGGNQAPGEVSGNASTQVKDPEIEALRRQLEEMKKQSDSIFQQTEKNKLQAEENSMKMERVLSGGPGDSFAGQLPGVGAIPPPGIRDDLTVPDYIRDSVAAPPGGYRSSPSQTELTELEKKVRSAPAIGKIASYDEGWNLVTIDAGSSSGVAADQRFSVRRGSEVLGVVKIIEVFPSQSNGTIVTNNREFDGALKPRTGDEIISFDPF